MKGADSLILVDTCGDHTDQDWIRKVPASTFCTTEVRPNKCQHIISHYLSQTLTTLTTEYKVKSLESFVGVTFEILITYVIFFCFLIERGSSKCMKGRIFPHSVGTIALVAHGTALL